MEEVDPLDPLEPYNITIPRQRYKELLEAERVLGLLERGGVDNWEWYGEALRGGLE